MYLGSGNLPSNITLRYQRTFRQYKWIIINQRETGMVKDGDDPPDKDYKLEMFRLDFSRCANHDVASRTDRL